MNRVTAGELKKEGPRQEEKEAVPRILETAH